MQTIVSFTQNDEEVFVHTFTGIGNIGNQPNSGNSTPKIVTCLVIVNSIHVMPGEVGPHFSI